MATDSTQKNSLKYCCNICHFSSSNKNDYNRHILTNKHKINVLSTNVNTESTEQPHICNICNKKYKERSGLWRHKKKCNANSDISDIAANVQSVLNDKDIIMALVKDNTDFKAMLIKVLENGTNSNNMLMKVLENGTNNNSNNINTNNSHNKTFNLQFFLNETCKNAMNIDEFVSSIKPTLEDLEHVGKVGYAEGISNIIIKRLNEVGVTERPIHCSDVKREVLYIKTDNVWNKETVEKPLLVNAIKRVAKDNMDNILVWQKANPGCTDSDSKQNKKYLNMVYNSMSGLSSDETNKNMNKIISRLSNNVQLTNCKSI